MDNLKNINAPLALSKEQYSIQLLQIHHLGYPHDASKLRIQIRPDNVIQLREKQLIIGVYTIESVQIYAIFDPYHIASLNFKSTTSLNVAFEDLYLCYKYGPILKKDKLDSAILIVKNSSLEDILNYFYTNCQDHNIFQWRQVIIQWFKTNSFKYLHTFQKFKSYKPTPDNYNYLRNSFNINFIRIEDDGFKIGFQPNTSLIVDDSIADYLTYSNHYYCAIYRSIFGDIFYDELTDILTHTPNLFFNCLHDRIELNKNYDKYFSIISEFLSNQPLKCATSEEINQYIKILYPSIKLDFQQTKSLRFKERIIAGKSEDFQSYYFDSEDKSIDDIVYYSKSYSQFLTQQFQSCDNIYDLYKKVYEIDPLADCYKFWSAFKRSIRSESFTYNMGHLSTDKKDDFRRDKIISILNTFFDNKESKYISFQKEHISKFKLNDHFIMRYLFDHFSFFEDQNHVNFEIDITYINNNKVSGFCILGKENVIGLFPIVAPEVFLNRNEKYFFCYNSLYYYITNNRGTINLQVI